MSVEDVADGEGTLEGETQADDSSDAGMTSWILSESEDVPILNSDNLTESDKSVNDEKDNDSEFSQRLEVVLSSDDSDDDNDMDLDLNPTSHLIIDRSQSTRRKRTMRQRVNHVNVVLDRGRLNSVSATVPNTATKSHTVSDPVLKVQYDMLTKDLWDLSSHLTVFKDLIDQVCDANSVDGIHKLVVHVFIDLTLLLHIILL
jgi:hypothetical protein